MNRPLRVGLIGCGHVARRYPAAIAATGRLVLDRVTDVDAAAGKRFGHDFDVAFAPSLDELLAAEPDLVCICTPSDTHAALAEACIGAGAHVVVEHPLALRASDGERLCRLAAARNRRLFVVRQRRFLHSVQALKRLVAEDALGTIERISATLCWHRSPEYYESRPWRIRAENGGVVRNQASHFLDVLVYVFGEARAAGGVLGNIRHAVPVEDSFSGSVEFAGSVTAEFSCTTAAASTWTRLVVGGTRGEVTLSGPDWNVLETRLVYEPNGSRSGDHADFLDRVARSLAAERIETVTAGDAIAELRLVETIYRTAERNDERVRAELLPLLDGRT